MYGYIFMAMYVWLCMYGYVGMAMCGCVCKGMYYVKYMNVHY